MTLGGESSTVFGLSGVGDTFGTCFGPLSRNRQVGLRLGQGESLEDILDSMSQVGTNPNPFRYPTPEVAPSAPEGAPSAPLLAPTGSTQKICLVPCRRWPRGWRLRGRCASWSTRG